MYVLYLRHTLTDLDQTWVKGPGPPPIYVTCPPWVKGQMKGQVFNFVRFRRLRCQIVRIGSKFKSVHGDPIDWPYRRGQRSKERSNFQLCPISTFEVSNCLSWTNNQKSVHGDPHRPTLRWGSKVKERSNFQLWSISKIKVSICLSWNSIQKCQWRPCLKGQTMIYSCTGHIYLKKVIGRVPVSSETGLSLVVFRQLKI